MKILGIDPGLQATGYGLIDVSAGPQPSIALREVGTIEPVSRQALPQRLDGVYRHLSDIIRQTAPHVLVLEKLYSHYRHPTTACLLGHVRGVIILCAARQNVPIVEHSVKRIRQALTGNGNASKQQVRAYVAHQLQFKADRLTLDASDALALALGFMRMESKNHLSRELKSFISK